MIGRLICCVAACLMAASVTLILITGAPHLGKGALSRAFARALNCEDEALANRPCSACRSCQAISRGNDPDLIVASRDEGAPLKIDAIREVTRLLALKPYTARYRIAIFEDFDLVAPLAQDAPAEDA